MPRPTSPCTKRTGSLARPERCTLTSRSNCRVAIKSTLQDAIAYLASSI
jgi:hypothetical protein